MRDGYDGAFVLLQVLFEPIDALGVEVVGRLVEQQHVGLLQQQTTQRHAATLAARQHLHALVGIGAAQGVHRALQHAVQLPAVHMVDLLVELALTLDETVHLVVRHGFAQLHVDILVLLEQRHRGGASLLHDLLHCLGVVELRLLLEITHRIPGSEDHLALIVFVDARDDLHQGRLTRSVETDDTDLGTIKEREVDVVENSLLVGERLRDAYHGKDDFFVCHYL